MLFLFHNVPRRDLQYNFFIIGSLWFLLVFLGLDSIVELLHLCFDENLFTDLLDLPEKNTEIFHILWNKYIISYLKNLLILKGGNGKGDSVRKKWEFGELS